MIVSSVAVLLLCIRTNDHAGGFCMSPILLYREKWSSNCIVDWNRLMLFIGSSQFAEIYLHSLLSCM
jgi:hypothetical protein